jgi:AraC-like DNA-binding protein
MIVRNNINTGYYFSLFQDIINETKNRGTAYIDFVNAYLRLISAWFMRIRTADNIIDSKIIDNTGLKKLRNLLEYVEKNYSQKITVKTGADILHLSESYFSKYFKTLCGVTFCRYVNSIRIGAAKNMLKTTNMKIIEISDNCGFETIRTFNREFKLMTGITAKEYR